MKTGLGITFVILGYYSVFAQENGAQDVKMKKPSVVKSSSAPVTHAEAKMVLDKAWNALAKGLKVKGANPVKIVNDQNPKIPDSSR